MAFFEDCVERSAGIAAACGWLAFGGGTEATVGLLTGLVGLGAAVTGYKRLHGPESKRTLQRIQSRIAADLLAFAEAERWELSAEIKAADFAMSRALSKCFLDRETLASSARSPDGFPATATQLILAALATQEPDTFGEKGPSVAKEYATQVIRTALEAAVENEAYFRAIEPYLFFQMLRGIGIVEVQVDGLGEKLDDTRRQQAEILSIVRDLKEPAPKPTSPNNRPEYAFFALNREVERLFVEGEVSDAFHMTSQIARLAINDMVGRVQSEFSSIELGNILVNGIRSSSYLADDGLALMDFLTTHVSSAIEAGLLSIPDVTAVQLELLSVNQGYGNYDLVEQLIEELEASQHLDAIMKLKLNSRRVLAGFTGGTGLDDATVRSLSITNENDSKNFMRSPLVRAWAALARGEVSLAETLVADAVQDLNSRKTAFGPHGYDAILELELRLTFKSFRRELDLQLHKKNDRAIGELYRKFHTKKIALRPLFFDLVSAQKTGRPNAAVVSYHKYRGEFGVSDGAKRTLARVTTTLFQSLRHA